MSFVPVSFGHRSEYESSTDRRYDARSYFNVTSVVAFYFVSI